MHFHHLYQTLNEKVGLVFLNLVIALQVSQCLIKDWIMIMNHPYLSRKIWMFSSKVHAFWAWSRRDLCIVTFFSNFAKCNGVGLVLVFHRSSISSNLSMSILKTFSKIFLPARNHYKDIILDKVPSFLPILSRINFNSTACFWRFLISSAKVLD